MKKNEAINFLYGALKQHLEWGEERVEVIAAVLERIRGEHYPTIEIDNYLDIVKIFMIAHSEEIK